MRSRRSSPSGDVVVTNVVMTNGDERGGDDNETWGRGRCERHDKRRQTKSSYLITLPGPRESSCIKIVIW